MLTLLDDLLGLTLGLCVAVSSVLLTWTRNSG